MSRKLWRVGDEEMAYVKKAIDGGLTGQYTKLFEAQFAEKFQSTYAVAMNSGTSALHAALAALGVGPGDEVITPPLTFAATTFCVLYVGAIPVFADVDPQTFNIDPKQIRRLITPKTKAIITVSLYGLSPDMDEIMAIAKEFNLKVLEDNAQSVLGMYKGKISGTIGHAAIFSLQRSKHLTTGDGGVVITDDEKTAERVRKIADLGYIRLTAKPISNENFKNQIQRPDYKRHELIGFNFRIPEVVAAMGIAQLDKVDMLVEKRVACAKYYHKATAGCAWISPQVTPSDCVHSYWTYVFKLDTAKVSWMDFRNKFMSNGGEDFYAAWSLTYLEPALQGKSFGQKQKFEPGLCPVAESLQPALVQLKTNFEDMDHARQQADILARTIKDLSR